jgi:hypothetical protein
MLVVIYMSLSVKRAIVFGGKLRELYAKDNVGGAEGGNLLLFRGNAIC